MVASVDHDQERSKLNGSVDAEKDSTDSEPPLEGVDKILQDLLDVPEDGSQSNRIPLFEALLQWSSTVYFHGLSCHERSRVTVTVLNTMRHITLTYLEDWQAVFDILDMMLYRLKSLGREFAGIFWKTLLHLGSQLALEKLDSGSPEFQSRVLRPMYATSSILINFHGPENAMELCEADLDMDGLSFERNPPLLELVLKFLVKAMLLFPHYTFPTVPTAELLIRLTLQCSVSIIRRACLEGMKALHAVKGTLDGGEDIKKCINDLLPGEKNSVARLAFIRRIERPESPVVEAELQQVRFWLSLKGESPIKSADVAWVAACEDAYRHMCEEDVYWLSTNADHSARAWAIQTHRLPVVEAGDCVRTAPDTSRSLTHEDHGAGDRAMARRKRNVTVTVDSVMVSSVHMEKPLSTTSLSTFNVEEPVMSAPREVVHKTRSDVKPIKPVKAPKLTGWAEKDELYCTSTDSSRKEQKRLAAKLDNEPDGTDSAKLEPPRSHTRTKKRPNLDLEKNESAPDVYREVTDDTSKKPDSMEQSSEVTVLKSVKKATTKRETKPVAADRVPVELSAPGQTTRLSRAPPLQPNATLDSIHDGSSAGTDRPTSAIVRETVLRKKMSAVRTSDRTAKTSNEEPPVQPQVKLIKAQPHFSDDEEPLPVIRDPRAPRKTATVAPPPMSQLDFDAMPIPTLLKNSQKTSRVNPALSEFDSGLFCDDMSYSSTNVDPHNGKYSIAKGTGRKEKSSATNRKYVKDAGSYSNATSRPPSSHTDMNLSVRRSSASSRSQQSDRSGISVAETDVPKGTRFKREEKPAVDKIRRKTTTSISAREVVDPKKNFKQRTKSPADARLNMTGGSESLSHTRKNQSYTVSRESGMESLNDDTSGISSKPRTRKMSRQDTVDISEAEKKPEEIRQNLQDLMDRMQKGTRFSNDIVSAIDEFVQLTKTNPRVVESAIGVVFSQFLPLVSSLNSHVAAEAISALEVTMPLLERRIHLVAPQIVEALSNNMQNARTSDHSKKVFTQILDMQVDRAGNLLVQLSSELRRIMKKNKKEAFAFITCKYAETLGRAFPKPPKSIAAAVEVLQFVRVVLVWITNYGDLDTSNKPEIVAVDILIQQAIRSFGAEILNKVCVDYRDTIKAFLSRRETKSGEKSLGNSMRSSGTSRASKVVERKSSLMAFQKRPR